MKDYRDSATQTREVFITEESDSREGVWFTNPNIPGSGSRERLHGDCERRILRPNVPDWVSDEVSWGIPVVNGVHKSHFGSDISSHFLPVCTTHVKLGGAGSAVSQAASSDSTLSTSTLSTSLKHPLILLSTSLIVLTQMRSGVMQSFTLILSSSSELSGLITGFINPNSFKSDISSYLTQALNNAGIGAMSWRQSMFCCI